MRAPAEEVERGVIKVVEELIQKGYLYFGAGGALGFDALASEAVLRLKKKYPQLTLEEIRHLLVEEKWFAVIYSGIDAIHEAVSHHLSARVTQLVERYEYTLKECEDEVDQYETKVKSHLERMGSFLKSPPTGLTNWPEARPLKQQAATGTSQAVLWRHH